jgi:hypothetical protein
VHARHHREGSNSKETCDVRQSNLDTALHCTARCCGRGFGDSARGHGDRSRVRATARFPGSQAGRYEHPSAHGKDAAVEAFAEVTNRPASLCDGAVKPRRRPCLLDVRLEARLRPLQPRRLFFPVSDLGGEILNSG